MPLVAMTREMGSLGMDVARKEWNEAARVVTSVHGVTGVKSELRVTAEIRSPMGE